VAQEPNRPSRRRFLFLLGGAADLAALPALRSGGLRKSSARRGPSGPTSRITVLHEDPRSAERAIDDAFAELERIEEAMSLYRPQSQLCRLNRDGVLERSRPLPRRRAARRAEPSERSGGAFDAPSSRSGSSMREREEGGPLPDADAVREATAGDWRKVEVAADRIRFRAAGHGGDAQRHRQGFAADRVRPRSRPAASATRSSNTGDSAAWAANGRHAVDGRDPAPPRPDAYLALAALEERFLSTSATTHLVQRRLPPQPHLRPPHGPVADGVLRA
jgi:thiamine biosynthesis lipoprotein